MSDNHIDYLEQLFQGVDILIERKLKDVSYDTTIVCTIIDDSDSKNGKYQVTDGTIRFDVYSDSDKYKVKDQVRVSIAKGDYSDKKYIIGKYVADNNTQPLTYVSPLDTVVNITGNLVPINRQNVGIIANKSDKPYIDIWSTSLADGRFADLQTNGIYSAITLKADFKTLMHSYNVKSGTYGLRLTLLVKPSKNSAGYIAKTAELSSDEMFGNPYAFSVSTEQTKVFDIGTEGLITNIALQLYQNNDFYDVNDVKIPVSLTENIIVNNIELGFGSDLTAIGDNTVKIYTESDSVYKYQGHTPAPYDRKLGYPNQLNAATNQKTLGILWYNKNDLNEYVGFSDGLYDPDYDEIAYLDLAREDTRLTAHIGREGVPTDKESLELAANIEEGKPLIESAMKVVTQDLITMLRALHAQFEGIDDFTTEINNCIISLKGIATDNANSIKNTLTLLDTQYSKILKYGKKKQDNEAPEPWESAWNVNNGEAIRNAFTAVRTTIQTLLEEKIAPRVAEDGDYSGYAGVYDTYKIRLNKVLTTMDEYLNENSKYRFPRTIFEGYSVTDEISGNTQTFTSDYTRLMRYNNQKTDWKSYLKKDLKEYENKYCIYWFRYEKDYISNEVHQFMPNGWRRLDASWNEYGYSVPANIGIPGKGEQIDGKTYNEKRLPPGEGMFNIMMRYNEPEERFVAVIFHNHNMYKSDELVFRNADRIPEVANIETGDLLIFEHSQDGKSRNDYQCYNLTNYLMDSADASHNRKIKVHYDGLLNGDEALVGGGLYWYVPLTATMLTFDLNVLQDNGFVSDQKLVEGKPEYIDPKPEYSKEGYACFYKQVTAVRDEETGEYNFVNNRQIDSRDFWYKIKPYYDATAVINSIKCEFRPAEDNDIVTGEEFFSFGIMGSNGTKYTLAITPSTNQVATTPSTELKLDLSLRDFNNEEIPIIKGQTGDGSATGLETEWLYAYKGIKPAEILSSVEGQDRVIGLTAVANSCGIVKATVNFQLSSEGAQEESGNIPVTKKRTVRLETVRAIALAAGDYYISGPTSIVYNSLGTIDNKSMFDNPYKLYALKNLKVGDTEYKANQEIPVFWEYTYHKHNNPNWPDGEIEQAEYDFYSRYMPVVNDAGGLTPAPMYLDELDCYLMVHAYTGTTTNKNYLYHQPVVITQNRFGSSVLNDWDGSLTIDEKNGTILSTMIGAGRKTIQNTFEGVLMGDVAVGTNSDTGFEQNNEIGIANHTGLGIYGFHDGSQSFGFNIDGTAFLGKAGRGRIIFNGNQGVIASTNWFLSGGTLHRAPPADGVSWIKSFGTDGMCIDLENGHIDAYNFKLTSKNAIIDSSETATAYLIVKNNDSGNNLIYISPSEYYIQSDDFDPNVKGMHLNLVDGEVIAYQFELDSKNIYINSDADGTGYGVIEIKGNDSGNSLTLTNDSAQDPIGIRDSSNNALFVVGWDGSITTPNFTVDGDGNLSATSGDIGGWKINKHSLSSNSTYLRSSAGDTIKAIEINSGTFYVQNNGYMYASSGSIGGWNISETKLSKGVIELTNAGTIQSTEGNMTIDGTTGKLSADGAELENLIVNTKLVMQGKMHIGTKPSSGSLSMPTNAQFMVSGDTLIVGKMRIQSNLNSSAAMPANAQVYVGGEMIVNGGFVIGKPLNHEPDSTYKCAIYGKTYLQNDIEIDADSGPRSIRAIGQNADKTTSLYFGAFGSSVDNGVGIGFNGNKCFMYTEQIWLGKSSTSTTYVNGNVQINGTGKFSIGKKIGDLAAGITFYLGSATGVYIGDGDKDILLSEYVKKAGGFTLIGENNYVTTYATMLFNGAANDGKGAAYSVGSYYQPVYFDGGVPKACGHSIPSPNNLNNGQVLKYFYDNATRTGEIKWASLDSITTTYGSYGVSYGMANALNNATKSDDDGYYLSVSYASSAGSSTNSTYARYINAQAMVDTDNSPCYVAGVQNTGNTSVRKAAFRIAAITPGSSRRFKENINILDYDISNNLYKLQPVSFYYKDKNYGDTKRYGFIAEDVYQIMPELVDMDKGECSALYYNSILTLAVAEIQKLRKELDDLKSNFNI